MMLEVADVFRRYGPAYLARFENDILPSHRRALADLVQCRTRDLGGYARQCNQCGHLVYSYRSCGNRHCPKCCGRYTESWLEKQRDRLLPVTYFHIVFTIPSELRQIVRANQKALYAVLFRSAAQALMQLSADPKHLGGQIGILAVLHTWTRTIGYHPHVHCLVPGGAVMPNGQWTFSHPSYLVPRSALAKLFRGKFMAMAKAALPNLEWPQAVWQKTWGIYLKPAVQGTDKVLDYLGRYVHRVALTNSRIQRITDDAVSIRYKDASTHSWKTAHFSPLQFIARFLQHVLPARVVKVRYYGILHPSKQPQLSQLKALFMLAGLLHQTCVEANRPTDSRQKPENNEVLCRCPQCGVGKMTICEVIYPKRIRPP